MGQSILVTIRLPSTAAQSLLAWNDRVLIRGHPLYRARLLLVQARDRGFAKNEQERNMAIFQAETTESSRTTPLCPLCHQMDQVQRLAEAYSRGDVHFSRPEGPPPWKRPFKVWPWAIIALAYVVVHGILLVQMGGAQAFASWPPVWQFLEVLALLVGLIIVVLLCLFAKVTT
jgi:hypothetical protein